MEQSGVCFSRQWSISEYVQTEIEDSFLDVKNVIFSAAWVFAVISVTLTNVELIYFVLTFDILLCEKFNAPWSISSLPS